MKLTKQSRKDFFKLIFFSAVAGTLLWAMIEILMINAGLTQIPSLPEISMDIYVIKIAIRLNPGSFIGLGLGILIFFRL